HSWSGQSSATRKSVWNVITAEERSKWLARALCEATGKTIVEAHMKRWRESGLFDTLIFDVEAREADDTRSNYLVKLFDRSRYLSAEQESTVLEAFPVGALPAAVLVGITSVEGH